MMMRSQFVIVQGTVNLVLTFSLLLRTITYFSVVRAYFVAWNKIPIFVMFCLLVPRTAITFSMALLRYSLTAESCQCAACRVY